MVWDTTSLMLWIIFHWDPKVSKSVVYLFCIRPISLQWLHDVTSQPTMWIKNLFLQNIMIYIPKRPIPSQYKFPMWHTCMLVPLIFAIFGFQVEKCAQPNSVQRLRFRIPLQILYVFRYRHLLLIPHSALNFQAIPDSAKKKGPIPPFRQPENPPPEMMFY